MTASRPASLPDSALALSLGLFGLLVSFLGSWIPSYWGDEAASVLSAERSLPSLFRLLGHVDAVHGTYYLILHFWIGAFGASEISTRLPSAIAAAFIVAGTFRLGSALASRYVGLVAAIVCAVLPSVQFFGAEARSYSIATALAVWASFWLLAALRNGRARVVPWVVYAILMTAGIYVFLYLALLIPVHVLYVASSRENRSRARRFALAIILCLVLVSPLVVIAYSQRSQISFLSSRRHLNYRSVFIYQWLGNGYLATVVWAIVVFAIVSEIVAWRRGRTRDHAVLFAVLLAAVPMGLLFAISLVTPTYDVRYLAFAAPAIALLVASGLCRMRWRVLRLVSIGVVILLALPTDIGQRGPNAYNSSSDWSRVAAIVAAHSAPGDGIVFDATTRPSQRPRLALRLYPADFAGLSDVELKQPFEDRTTLWDSTYPITAIESRLVRVHAVLLVEQTDTPDSTAGTNILTLRGLGYVQTIVGSSGKVVVYRFVKRG